MEVSSRPLVWQTRSLQPRSVCLVAGGHHQHHALGLRVVHRSCVEPGILGSDEPLHGGQWRGHNGKLIHGAKRQIRICVLGAYSLRHTALNRAQPPRPPLGIDAGEPLHLAGRSLLRMSRIACRSAPCAPGIAALSASAPPTRALPNRSVEQDQRTVLPPALRPRNNRNNGRHGRRGNLREGRRGSLQDNLRVSGVSDAFVIGIGRTDAKTEREGPQET